MMTNDLFLKATRNKIRFETPKGSVTVEDLWDLPLTAKNGASLDDIARNLHRALKSDDHVSFVNKTTSVDTAAREKFDLVKFVIDTRIAENEAAALKKQNAERKQQLLGVLATKENDKLASASMDEIRAMIAAL